MAPLQASRTPRVYTECCIDRAADPALGQAFLGQPGAPGGAEKGLASSRRGGATAILEAAKLEQFSVSARIRSVRQALRGIWVMLSTQHNAWIHAVAATAVVGAGIALHVSRGEWLALVLAIMAVWTAEALNTAFESLCDVASPEFHPLVERAKDVAAGAVLISAIGAVAIGLLVFGPRLLGQ